MDDPARHDVVQRVAQHAIKLQHPNVCRVLELGQAQGRHYIVREYDEAATLADILQRRNKLPHDQAARIFALASEGLRALHEHGVPGGVLTADCVLLAVTGKGGARSQRTVRLLVAAVRKDIFDARAIGADAGEGKEGIPDELQLTALTNDAAGLRPTQPPEDILRLGCLFYRCLTGKDPFPADLLPQPGYRAAPVAESAPEVPEALTEIVEGMIDPDLARRPKSAGHVAKAIRVFLRAEEEAREVREEEQVVIPKKADHQQAVAEEEVVEAEAEEEDEEETPRRVARARPAESVQGAVGKIREVWEELRPEPREWLYVGIGAALMIMLILLLEFITGIRFVHLVLLATGAALTFLVERLVRWWESRQAGAGEKAGA
jgi:serine/threonine-protein kinase